MMAWRNVIIALYYLHAGASAATLTGHSNTYLSNSFWVVRYVIGTVDPKFLSPLSYILCRRESPLVRCRVIWDSLLMDQVIFEPPEWC